MKKLVMILSFLMFAVMVNAQRGAVQTVADEIEGATVMNANLPTVFGGKYLLTVQVLCTQRVGTSEGTLVLQGSVDGTTYVTLNNTVRNGTTQLPNNEGLVYAVPNDTLTVTNGAKGVWIVKDTPWKNYRLTSTGGAGDTTTLAIKYVYK